VGLVAAAEEAGEGLDGLLGLAEDDRIRQLEERLSDLEGALRVPTGDQPVKDRRRDPRHPANHY
jgi:hypothetical protein